MGWSSPEIKQWSSMTKRSPYGNDDFKEKYINAFRKLIRIDKKKNDLAQIFDELIKDNFKDSDWEITTNSSLKRLDFYCHVPSVVGAFDLILKEMLNHSSHKKINIKTNKEAAENYRVNNIFIEQLGSYPEIDISDIKDNWIKSIEKGEMGEIRKNLFRQANWSIETKAFNNDDKLVPVKVNMLLDDNEPNIEYLKTDKGVNGFKHTITFFYRP
ncbi:MAG: hypothetical protein U5K72_16040 [Balneolaceae bacterium]|nr:hypothetical protein [Balneolaceae bacterium]